MARWFPRADGKTGLNTALLIGFLGALIVAAMDSYGVVARVLRLDEYRANGVQEIGSVLLIVRICFVLVDLIAAWRFAGGKGLLWGSVVLLFVVLPIFGYFFMGKTSANIAWILVRFPVAAALIVGIGGAWAARRMTRTPPNYAGVFE